MKEVEQRAEAVLVAVPPWIWDGESLPVPVEDIVDSEFGLLVRDVEEMTAAPGCPALAPGQSLSGLLLAGRGEIWVNAAEAREWPPRRRFTIGHELGHWVLHRTGQESLFCRSTSVEPDETSAKPANTRPPLPVTETEANIFAAALTMPAHLIQRHYEATHGDHAQLCEIFASSGAAMGRRLHAVIPLAEQD
jgi:uncharacterized protein DUF955